MCRYVVEFHTGSQVALESMLARVGICTHRTEKGLVACCHRFANAGYRYGGWVSFLMQQFFKAQDQSRRPSGSTSITRTRIECLSSGKNMVACVRLLDAAFREHPPLELLVDL